MSSIRPDHHSRLDNRVRNLTRRSERLASIRLFIFLISLALLTIGALGTLRTPMYILGGGALFAFAWLMRTHRQVDQALRLFRGRLGTLERQLATRELQWEKIPSHRELPANRPIPPSLHDLDIVGAHSLLQLMDYTVSSSGFDRLLSLFSENEIPDEEIARRSRLTSELRSLRVLRHGFVARLSLFPGTIEKQRLIALLEKPLALEGSWGALLVLLVLQGLWLGSLFYFLATGGAPYFLIALVLLILGHTFSHRFLKTGEAYSSAISIVLFMEKFAAAARVLEKYSSTEKPELRNTLIPFSGGKSASTALRRLDWTAGALGVRQNFIAHGLVHAIFPWDPFWTLRLHRIQKQIGNQLPDWGNALAELEAFLSVANYWEANESFRTAKIIDHTTSSPFLRGENVRHPLLPQSRAIGNDLELNESERCALITGSNMSGKSTFLRAIGVNVLLAKAGAPVAADTFVFQNAPLFTSLRVEDSLDEGLSSFYAETKRLAGILEVARRRPPVIFLIDEIFRGTNNRERLIGSRAFVREITRTGNYGLVTTHDLELCTLADSGNAIANYHFREDFQDGKMTFHYQKRPGPCPTTNALEVMRLSGLPVE